MNNYKTIIEIGSYSIKTIIYSDYNGDSKIIGTGKSRTLGYTGNAIENIDDFIDCIKNSIVQSEKQANYIIKEAYILMTNSSINIKKIKKDLILNGSIIEKKWSKKNIKNQYCQKWKILSKFIYISLFNWW